MGDYVPKVEAKFNSWQENLLKIVTENATAWSIPVDTLTAASGQQTVWATAYAKAINKQNRTSADVLVKEQAKHDFTKCLRNLSQQWLARNPLVSDADRVRMNITVYNNSRTPVPAPETVPIGIIDFTIRLQHTINFYDESSAHSSAKPKGVSACEVYMKVDGEAPSGSEEMQFLGSCSASPFVVKFKGSQAGKTVWYLLRWVNSKGEAGPWSTIINGTVVG